MAFGADQDDPWKCFPCEGFSSVAPRWEAKGKWSNKTAVGPKIGRTMFLWLLWVIQWVCKIEVPPEEGERSAGLSPSTVAEQNVSSWFLDPQVQGFHKPVRASLSQQRLCVLVLLLLALMAQTAPHLIFSFQYQWTRLSSVGESKSRARAQFTPVDL